MWLPSEYPYDSVFLLLHEPKNTPSILIRGLLVVLLYFASSSALFPTLLLTLFFFMSCLVQVRPSTIFISVFTSSLGFWCGLSQTMTLEPLWLFVATLVIHSATYFKL